MLFDKSVAQKLVVSKHNLTDAIDYFWIILAFLLFLISFRMFEVDVIVVNFFELLFLVNLLQLTSIRPAWGSFLDSFPLRTPHFDGFFGSYIGDLGDQSFILQNNKVLQ